MRCPESGTTVQIPADDARVRKTWCTSCNRMVSIRVLGSFGSDWKGQFPEHSLPTPPAPTPQRAYRCRR